MQQPHTPELPETFLAEFNSKTSDVITSMSRLGGFVFESGGPQGEGAVSFKGQRRGDGTTIEITIKKGDNYRSPAELEAEASSEVPDENLQ